MRAPLVAKLHLVESSTFVIEPWISQVQSTWLLSVFLRAYSQEFFTLAMKRTSLRVIIKDS